MADKKAKSRIGKHDAGQLDRWHRNAAKSRVGKGAAPGNRNSLVHGIYADRFLAPEERPLLETIIAQLYQDFVFNKSSDFMQVELVAVYFLKLGRAQEVGDWDAAEKLDRMIRCHLKDLKATKAAREGVAVQDQETTPAATPGEDPEQGGVTALPSAGMSDNTSYPTFPEGQRHGRRGILGAGVTGFFASRACVASGRLGDDPMRRRGKTDPALNLDTVIRLYGGDSHAAKSAVSEKSMPQKRPVEKPPCPGIAPSLTRHATKSGDRRHGRSQLQSPTMRK